jgi:hypothetical protein
VDTVMLELKTTTGSRGEPCAVWVIQGQGQSAVIGSVQFAEGPQSRPALIASLEY